jgi:hypothetical protein
MNYLLLGCTRPHFGIGVEILCADIHCNSNKSGWGLIVQGPDQERYNAMEVYAALKPAHNVEMVNMQKALYLVLVVRKYSTSADQTHLPLKHLLTALSKNFSTRSLTR